MKQPTAEEFDAILEQVRKENPGTDIWAGGQNMTGVRYAFRGTTKAESKIFRKMTREQREKGALADFDLPNEMVASACVIWPPKDVPAGADPEQAVTLPKLFAAYPMISANMADDISRASGAGDAAETKKL